ncbi:uncharacterized protein LOC126961472 [Macaca thibetana thibetana]|uniref:uncharacterized protein LOC126961472 n=1 Tax=Macaca thibetana thibetana TaxID=257877 RepID=UPI0021BC3E97|nr:uncharacterized protein LOC126961472 [Macaca thibetana thibetana]
MSELRLSLGEACCSSCGGWECGSQANRIMFPGGLWLPLLCHVGYQGRRESHNYRPHLAPMQPKKLVSFPLCFTNSTEFISRQWVSRAEKLPQVTSLLAEKASRAFRFQASSSAVASVLCLYSRFTPSPSSVQETSCSVKFITKFSWKFPSLCGLFPVPLAALPRDPYETKSEMASLGTECPLLLLLLYFTWLSKFIPAPGSCNSSLLPLKGLGILSAFQVYPALVIGAKIHDDISCSFSDFHSSHFGVYLSSSTAISGVFHILQTGNLQMLCHTINIELFFPRQSIVHICMFFANIVLCGVWDHGIEIPLHVKNFGNLESRC